MRKLVLIALFLPFIGKAQFKIFNTATINLLELRSGTWPITLQRITKESDTTYVLLFRDQQYTNTENMTTMKFRDMEQLKYFQKALAALKSGNNGDVAKFADYSVKRSDVKREGTWYILTCADGPLTNFQQPEADRLISTIAGL